jgi:DNA uptake protein ComE-like DNA-binding protein
MSGRLIRHRMLITPDGQWKKHLWLDEIVLASDKTEAEQKAPKPELTTPLPVNTCSVDSLTLLPGVGPVLAGRIHDVRAEGHIFRNAGDLLIVKGIGPKLSVRLAPLICFAVEVPADSVSEDSP